MKPRFSHDSDSRSGTSSANSLPAALARDLERLLGPAGFILEPERLLVYESDALTRIRGTPQAVLIPGSRRELQRAIRKLYEAAIPFVPRGMGTGLAGGAVAQGSVVVSTARLDRILDIDPGERLAVVEPGVITEEISRRAAPAGLRYLPDPGSASACTIGGNVATNAGGPHCLRHGVTTDHVLGLGVLLADGRSLTLDRGESGGLDLSGLVVGSEGTLGVVAEVTVRLEPVTEATRTALVLFDRIADAGKAVTQILAAGVLPVALEIIDRTTIRVVERSPFAVGLPTDVGAALVIECEGSSEDAEECIAGALAAVRDSRPREILTADSDASRDRLWQARKKAFGALGRLGPDVLIEDAVVPRTALPELLARLEAVAARYELPLANFFHAGDGNLHPNIVFDVNDASQVERVEAARSEMLEMCLEAGGTITGEHGVGLDKLDAMSRIFGAAELDALRAMRRAFDPEERCNPGKAVPAAGKDGDATGPGTSSTSFFRPVITGRGAHAPSHETMPTPRSVDDLQAFVESRPTGPLVVTGAELDSRPTDAAGTMPAPSVVSTARLGEVVEYRRDDLTVTVGAGMRVASLLSMLASEGQWIPVEGRALGLSVGGLIAAAPPGAFDARFGPVRRQILALRAVSLSGVRQRWGRAVMKNVAGYDLVRLYCGSFGRLGVIYEATFRVWPLIAAVRLVAHGPAVTSLLERMSDAVSPAAEGRRWTRNFGDRGVTDELSVWLWGSRRSIDSRAEAVRRVAELVGCTLDTRPTLWTTLPDTAGRRDRSVLRASAAASDFSQLANRLSEVLVGREARIDAMPDSGALRVEYGRSESEPTEVLARLLDVGAGAAFSLERGLAAEHEMIASRRPADVRQLEDHLVMACGGQPRCWQADYM